MFGSKYKPCQHDKFITFVPLVIYLKNIADRKITRFQSNYLKSFIQFLLPCIEGYCT